MNTFKTSLFSSIVAIALILPTAAEAGVRFSAGGYNPETGNAGRVAGGYNSQTGARYGRGSSYDASTNTYQGSTRAYTPSTGQGFTSSTTAAPGSGVTSSINTLNNGSYECSVSQELPAHCVETHY